MTRALPPAPAAYAKRMPPHHDARRLVGAGRDASGRVARLTASTARSWKAMAAAARAAGFRLKIVSAFRSRRRQALIIARKLRAGQSLASILRVSAYPGHSEHHTGRAIDIGAGMRPGLKARFSRTREYAWLKANAHRFGFTMTYPRGNRFGIAFEPWHWCHRGSKRRSRAAR